MAEDQAPQGEPPSTPPPSTPPEAPEADPPEQGDAAAEAARWKAFSRKNEDAFKAATKRIEELEGAGRSELEKATTRAEKAERARDEALGRALRAEVAARKGLSATQAKRLQGSTEEELEADADELLAAFKPAESHEASPNGDRADRAPSVRLRPGAVPDAGEAPEMDPQKLAASISRRSF